jgi:hypothetical protein
LILFNAGNLFCQDAEVKKFVETEKKFKTDSMGWFKGGFFTSTFNSVGLSNWAAGGQSSVAVGATGNIFAIYKQEKYTWENYLDLAWGSMRNGSAELPNGNKNLFIKNEDKLILLSKYGRRISDKLNYTGLFKFSSQAFPGFTELDPSTGELGQHISNFLAPAFGLISAGIDYKPNKAFSFFASPLTGKFTIVREQRLADLGSFGVQGADRDEFGNIIPGTGQTFRSELGWYINMMYVKDVMENVNINTKLDLFNNYQTLGLIDVNWETTVNFKINKFLTTTLFAHLIYDDDIDTNPETEMKEPRIQFKHMIGIGLAYKFGDSL